MIHKNVNAGFIIFFATNVSWSFTVEQQTLRINWELCETRQLVPPIICMEHVRASVSFD